MDSAEAQWRADDSEYLRWTGATSALMGPLVQPLWIGVDAMTQPDRWLGYLVPRGIFSFLCVVLAVSVWRTRSVATRRTLVCCLYIIGGGLIGWTVPAAGDAYALYVLGASLIVWGGGSFLALPASWSALTFGGLLLAFLLVHLQPGDGPNLTEFVVGTTYIATAGLLCGVSVVVRHRTRRRSFEATWALSERNRQLAASELEVLEQRTLSAAKNAFLARMSHELRTPLNAILGYAELAEEGIDDGAHDEARADLGRVRSAGTHLLRLVGDILDLTAIESGQVPFDPSPVELLSVAEEVTDDVRGAAAHKSLDVDCSGTPVTVVHDPARVRQVLAAILSNAVKFTDTGGVRVRAEPGDHGAVLRIEDTGPGMDDETLARAGEIFEQGDGSSTRAHEGTGLGLPVALGLARSMGWRVDMESTPGEGSIFTMFIPSVHPGHGASTDLA